MRADHEQDAKRARVPWSLLWLVLVLVLALAVPASARAAGACPPAGRDAAKLLSLKAAGFEIADAAERFALAQGLLPCLASADPALRDGVAYEALAHWMRAGEFDAGQLRVLRDALFARLERPDGAGFDAPFAALVLAEVARTDRIQPWMSQFEASRSDDPGLRQLLPALAAALEG